MEDQSKDVDKSGKSSHNPLDELRQFWEQEKMLSDHLLQFFQLQRMKMWQLASKAGPPVTHTSRLESS